MLILIALAVMALALWALWTTSPIVPDEHEEAELQTTVRNRRAYQPQPSPILRLSHLGRVMQAREAVRGDCGYVRRT
ncbi:hypothetical protein [Deinococcus navajonensis]|uniref:Uncharacterized protein n=1 Tax=Deinococcus navajonensis TaxID=309884 RepID=A0ABV8XII3_9DEIO